MILGALAYFDIIKRDWLNQFFPTTAEKKTESSQLLDQKPFLVLNLNVPLILDALENRLEPDKKTASLQMMMSLIKPMELSQLEQCQLELSQLEQRQLELGQLELGQLEQCQLELGQLEQRFLGMIKQFFSQFLKLAPVNEPGLFFLPYNSERSVITKCSVNIVTLSRSVQ